MNHEGNCANFFLLAIAGTIIVSCSTVKNHEKTIPSVPVVKTENLTIRNGKYLLPDLKRAHNIYSLEELEHLPEMPKGEFQQKKIAKSEWVSYVNVTDEVEANTIAVYKIYGNKCILTTTRSGPYISQIKLLSSAKKKTWQLYSKYHLTITTGDINEKHEGGEEVGKHDNPLFEFTVPKSTKKSFVDIFINPEIEVRRE